MDGNQGNQLLYLISENYNEFGVFLNNLYTMNNPNDVDTLSSEREETFQCRICTKLHVSKVF